MMCTGTFTDDFKRDAVAQITERGYPVKEASERLGVSAHSLYAWKRKFAKTESGDSDKDAEIRRLKRELLRVTEERDILKTVPGCSPPVRDINSLCYTDAEGQLPMAYWRAGPR